MMKFANAFETESFVIKEELHTYHSKLPQKGNLGIYDVVSQLDLVGTRTIVQVINFVRFKEAIIFWACRSGQITIK